jgi:hypothetical protein
MTAWGEVLSNVPGHSRNAISYHFLLLAEHHLSSVALL